MRTIHMPKVNQKNRPFGLYNNRNLIGYLLVNRLLFIH